MVLASQITQVVWGNSSQKMPENLPFPLLKFKLRNCSIFPLTSLVHLAKIPCMALNTMFQWWQIFQEHFSTLDSENKFMHVSLIGDAHCTWLYQQKTEKQADSLINIFLLLLIFLSKQITLYCMNTLMNKLSSVC